MKKTITKTTAKIFFIAVFLLSILAIKNWDASAATNEIIITEPTVWSLDNAPVIIDNTKYVFKSNLTITEGVTINLKNESAIIIEGKSKNMI